MRLLPLLLLDWTVITTIVDGNDQGHLANIRPYKLIPAPLPLLTQNVSV
jgi:hypothetical protein